jgi:beta-mannosidase
VNLQVVRDRVPGAAPVSLHSRFTAVAQAVEAEAAPAEPAPVPVTSDVRRIDLAGEWRRQAFSNDPAQPPVGREFDDGSWPQVRVPDNYGLDTRLSTHFGPVFYRRRLTPLESPFSRLVFDGVDYLARVWLDGALLGEHEGFFAPFSFDVTDKVRTGSVLAVRVQDPFEDLPADVPFYAQPKRVIKGTLKHHDSRPGGLPGSAGGWTPERGQSPTTGGIVQGVRLEGTGCVRIDALFVTPLDVDRGVIQIALVVTNNSREQVAARVELEATATDRRDVGALALLLEPGPSRVDVRAVLPDPLLWWPLSHGDLGKPELYTLAAAVLVADRVSDQCTERFGMRTARVTDGASRHLAVNERAVFVKAANYIPRQHFADADTTSYRGDLQLAAAAHLNSVGVHGHLQPPACYAAADEEGFLVFQDFPLQWHYDSGTATNPGFIETACRQIAEMAYVYWNHPSIVYWACHNEPAAVFRPGAAPDPELDPDNQVLDAALEERLRQVEPLRHVQRSSGIGDLHIYEGSVSGGEVYDVREKKTWFVSEFGFWSLGPQAHLFGDTGWPPDELQLREWESRLSFPDTTMAYAGLPSRYGSLDAWVRATAAYAAFLAKYQTEWFRINRGRPYFGYRWHFFVDWWGWAGAGLVDVDRHRKAAYDALAAASRPVLVATSLPHTVYQPGTRLCFPIQIVNDTREEVKLDVRWRWRLAPTVVMGVDAERPTRHPLPEHAMVAVPGGDSEEVVTEGIIAARCPPERAVRAAELELVLPGRALSGATLELEWDEHHENWFHVLAAPPDWFCGPGAFRLVDGQLSRLGQ